MSKDKKSFVIYTDLIHTFEHLSNEQRGEVIWWVLEYVNDKDPEPLNGLLAAVVEPIKQQLKRDLKKWDDIKVRRSEAGKRSAEAKKQRKAKATSVKQASTNSTSVKSVEQNSTNSTVSVNDTVSVSVNVNDNVSTDVDVLHDDTVSYPLRSLFEAYIEDDQLTQAIINNKTFTRVNSMDQLAAELRQFTEGLQATGERMKTTLDYRRHFANWLKKRPAQKTRAEYNPHMN